MLSKHDKAETAFFDALRVMVTRFTQTTGAKITRKEINQRINDLLKQSIKSEGVINLFADVKQEFSLFDEQFMKELQQMKQKNIALELLKNLLKDKVATLKRTNVVQSELFSNMLTESLNRYIKGLLTNEEIIKELMEMAKSIHKEEEEGNKLGLSVEEKAFYDALTRPEMVRKCYTDEEFIALTKELTEVLRKNRTIDWRHKESARAQMRVMIKRLLKKYKYPPEGAEEALQTVMAQCDNWADNEENYVKYDTKVYDMYTTSPYSSIAAEDVVEFQATRRKD
jgi:type I restriction enzyme R subunit